MSEVDVEHAIATLDATPYSAVLVCTCGHRALGVGADPEGNARYWGQVHRGRRKQYAAEPAVVLSHEHLVPEMAALQAEGHSQRAIAKRLDISQAAVSKWLSRAAA